MKETEKRNVYRCTEGDDVLHGDDDVQHRTTGHLNDCLGKFDKDLKCKKDMIDDE